MNRSHLGLLACVALSATLGAAAQAPTEYASGHGALEYFDEEGVAAAPLWVKIWLFILLGTFASSLFFVLRRPIASFAAGGFILSATTSSYVFEALGLPFLSGAIAIAHIVFWSPALILLLLQRPFLNSNEGRLYRIWSGAMTAVILFSFVFDIRDAAIYIAHFAG